MGFHRHSTETDYIFNQSIPVGCIEKIVQLLQNEMTMEKSLSGEYRSDDWFSSEILILIEARYNTTDLTSLSEDDNSNRRVSVSFHDLRLSPRLLSLILFVAMLTRAQSYKNVSLRRYIRSLTSPLNDFTHRIQIRQGQC